VTPPRLARALRIRKSGSESALKVLSACHSSLRFFETRPRSSLGFSHHSANSLAIRLDEPPCQGGSSRLSLSERNTFRAGGHAGIEQAGVAGDNGTQQSQIA